MLLASVSSVSAECRFSLQNKIRSEKSAAKPNDNRFSNNIPDQASIQFKSI